MDFSVTFCHTKEGRQLCIDGVRELTGKQCPLMEAGLTVNMKIALVTPIAFMDISHHYGLELEIAGGERKGTLYSAMRMKCKENPGTLFSYTGEDYAFFQSGNIEGYFGDANVISRDQFEKEYGKVR